MELNQQGFLEELLAFRRDTWETMPSFPSEMSELFSSGLNFDCFDDNLAATLPPNTFHEEFSSPLDQDFNNYYFNEVSCPFGDEFSTPSFTDEFSAPQFTDSSYNTLDTLPFPVQEDTPISTTMEDDQDLGLLPNHVHSLDMQDTCKVERIQSPQIPVFNIGSCPERKMRGKKLEGQPSKNLMGREEEERDYVKELLERIQSLQQEIEVGSDQLNMMGILKDTKASEFIVRNSPKFDVERVNEATRIEICCAAKPGLLLSTVNTLEALGLEIQQCVISCFNDFAMQASCSEELEQRRLISSDDIKQALFRSAGYGGRCL
ncbi:hypothetical protein GH714_009329 [Hevea brasiliensis]|uniref:Plant bHLH transcription factor ACT-like domain-containing protein n=1 Tax=Hevea brasiliensis TaxID=3981 RepID=A0A6A6NGB1_HEVBR|nr:hypothetical protein GH714_009329 [Hevea brasiliensis]